MAQALYRKYRPTSLKGVVGQQHVTEVLENALKNGRINHAYLLTGPRGVGKTSIARILAHRINGLDYSFDQNLDIIEIDAASNNGVDDVRDLREKVTIVPVSAKKKIYIIDEVHMLSKPAFNALLKTLEEPPEHVVFILATTEVHKIPDTILSRSQRFHFRQIDARLMQSQLRSIAKAEKIAIDDAALALIAMRARGSFRDAISLLDQLSSLSQNTVTTEMIEASLGLAAGSSVELLSDLIIAGDLAGAVKLLSEMEQAGISATVLAEQLQSDLKTRIVAKPRLIAVVESLLEVARSSDPALKLLAVVASSASQKPRPAAALTATIKPSIQAETLDNTKTKSAAGEFDWAKLLAYVRGSHPVLFGVLARAETSYNDGVLNLHFSYSLHRKKLESGRHKQLLSESLAALYAVAPVVTISSGKKAPTDQKAAAVAELMGGGEQVELS